VASRPADAAVSRKLRNLPKVKHLQLQPWRMTRLPKLQVIGPVCLFVAVLSAEGAAWALSHAPSSEILWFVNLRVFGIFQKSYYLLSSQVSIQYIQFLIVAPIFATACSGLVFNCRLLLPIASNLSFLYVAFLIYAWYLVESPPQAASLAEASYHSAVMTMPSGPDLCMFIVLFAATLPSFAASHIVYFRAVRDGQ
jgi:hypothetical protein